MKKNEKKVTENETKSLSEKIIRETVFSIISEILKLQLPKKTAIKVVSSVVFASKVYKIEMKK